MPLTSPGRGGRSTGGGYASGQSPVGDPTVVRRIRLINKFAPDVAKHPGNALSLAQNSVGENDDHFLDRIASSRGWGKTRNLARRLRSGIDPKKLSDEWHGLQPEKQALLVEMGINPKDFGSGDDGDDGIWGDIKTAVDMSLRPLTVTATGIEEHVGRPLGAAGGEALNLMNAGSDAAKHLYRAGTDISGHGVDAKAFLRSGGNPAVAGIAQLAAHPDMLVNQVKFWAGEVLSPDRLGDRRPGVGVLKDPTKFSDVWERTGAAKGEDYIRQANVDDALEHVDGDHKAYNLALEVSRTGDVKAAAHNYAMRAAGLEEGAPQQALLGTPAYGRAFKDAFDRMQDKGWEAATRSLADGKVSFGRDFVRSVGLRRGQITVPSAVPIAGGMDYFDFASGVVDAGYTWYSDPMMLGSYAYQGVKASRAIRNSDELNSFFKTQINREGIQAAVDAADRPRDIGATFSNGVVDGRAESEYIRGLSRFDAPQRRMVMAVDTFAENDPAKRAKNIVAFRRLFPNGDPAVESLIQWDAMERLKPENALPGRVPISGADVGPLAVPEVTGVNTIDRIRAQQVATINAHDTAIRQAQSTAVHGRGIDTMDKLGNYFSSLEGQTSFFHGEWAKNATDGYRAFPRLSWSGMQRLRVKLEAEKAIDRTATLAQRVARNIDTSMLTEGERFRYVDEVTGNTYAVQPQTGQVTVTDASGRPIELSEHAQPMSETEWVAAGLAPTGSLPLGSRLKLQAAKRVGGLGTAARAMTTNVPKSKAISLYGPDAATEVLNLAKMGLPDAAAYEHLGDFMTAANAAGKRRAVKSILQATMNRMGLADSEIAEEVLRNADGHAYGILPGTDLINQGDEAVPSAIHLQQIAENKVAIPDYTELLRASEKAGAWRAMGVAINDPRITKIMTEGWKPSVLMRAGFLLRVVGEEGLALVAKVGLDAPVQHWFLQPLARRGVTKAPEDIVWFLQPAARLERRVRHWQDLGSLQRAEVAAQYDYAAAERLGPSLSTRFEPQLTMAGEPKKIPFKPGQVQATMFAQDMMRHVAMPFANQTLLRAAEEMMAHPIATSSYAEGIGAQYVWTNPADDYRIEMRLGPEGKMIKLRASQTEFQRYDLTDPQNDFLGSVAMDDHLSGHSWNPVSRDIALATQSHIDEATARELSSVGDAADGRFLARRMRDVYMEMPDSARINVDEYIAHSVRDRSLPEWAEKERELRETIRRRTAAAGGPALGADEMLDTISRVKSADASHALTFDETGLFWDTGRGFETETRRIALARASEGGDRKAMEDLGDEMARARGTSPEHIRDTLKLDRSGQLIEGVQARDPVPNGAQRLWYPMLPESDAQAAAQALARADETTTGEEQLVAEYLYLRNRMSVDELLAEGPLTPSGDFKPFSGLSTSDPGQAMEIARGLAKKSGKNGAGWTIGYVDVPDRLAPQWRTAEAEGLFRVPPDNIRAQGAGVGNLDRIDHSGAIGADQDQIFHQVAQTQRLDLNHTIMAGERPAYAVTSKIARGHYTASDLRSTDGTRLASSVIGRQMMVPPHGPWMRTKEIFFRRFMEPGVRSMLRNPMYLQSFSDHLPAGTTVGAKFFQNPKAVSRAKDILALHGYTSIDDAYTDLKWVGRELVDENEKLNLAQLYHWRDTNRDIPKVFDDILDSVDVPPHQLEQAAQAADKQLAGIGNWLKRETTARAHGAEIAAQGALREVGRLIDDSTLRSQMSDYVKNISPFYFANELFLKRWARTLASHPEAARRVQLLMMGARHAGFIEKNDRGETVFMYPGSEILQEVVGKALAPVMGDDYQLPIEVPLTGEVKFAAPGFDRIGVPSVSPLVGIPLNLLGNRFPEMKQLEATVQGPAGAEHGIIQQLVPASITRFYKAFAAQPDADEQMASAMINAMQLLEAQGHGLPDDATDNQVEDYLDRVEGWARNLAITRAMVGFAGPAAPTADLSDSIGDEYRQLLQSLPIEEALATLVKLHPNATPYTIFKTRSKSKAPLSSSERALNFMTRHEAVLSDYPLGGAWLLPQDETGDEYTSRAFNQQLAVGLRERKSPKEFYVEMKFAKSAPLYFKMKDRYERAGLSAATSTQRQQMDQEWSLWKESYFKMHPTFKNQLQSSAGKERRASILDELRIVRQDDRLPSSARKSRIYGLLDAYDELSTRMDELRYARGTRATQQRRNLRVQFMNFADRYVERYPHTAAFFQRVIRPEVQITDAQLELAIGEAGFDDPIIEESAVSETSNQDRFSSRSRSY